MKNVRFKTDEDTVRRAIELAKKRGDVRSKGYERIFKAGLAFLEREERVREDNES